uniref:Uncharacterized protein n=1 Tax=Acrobeloides nanus TaxID=290746 RepID=A0A914DJU7_9BILA
MSEHEEAHLEKHEHKGFFEKAKAAISDSIEIVKEEVEDIMEQKPHSFNRELEARKHRLENRDDLLLNDGIRLDE